MDFSSVMGMLGGMGGGQMKAGDGSFTGTANAIANNLRAQQQPAASAFQQPGLQAAAKQQRLLDPELERMLREYKPMDTTAPSMTGVTSMRY